MCFPPQVRQFNRLTFIDVPALVARTTLHRNQSIHAFIHLHLHSQCVLMLFCHWKRSHHHICPVHTTYGKSEPFGNFQQNTLYHVWLQLYLNYHGKCCWVYFFFSPCRQLIYRKFSLFFLFISIAFFNGIRWIPARYTMHIRPECIFCCEENCATVYGTVTKEQKVLLWFVTEWKMCGVVFGFHRAHFSLER